MQKVGNGHPGTAMTLAPVAYLLYQNVMRHDPSDPHWLGRDRFVLSCGHSSLTQYVQLYLSGYGLELDDLKALRTWGSQTPGHPEVHHTNGVEITTGPLGSAWPPPSAWRWRSAASGACSTRTPPRATSPFDHHVYVLASDGDMQEGVSAEACSLAGHQELGNLTLIYDANQISIEDDTDIAFSEDVAERFEAYGWHVVEVDWRSSARTAAPTSRTSTRCSPPSSAASRSPTSRPSSGCTRSSRGPHRPSRTPASRTARPSATTRSPPPRSCSASTRRRRFAVERRRARARPRGRQPRQGRRTREWDKTLRGWRKANPERRRPARPRRLARQLPEGLDEALPTFPADAKGLATRAASGKVLTALADVMPELWGGSADLAESNNTTMDGVSRFIPTDRQTSEWKGGPYGRTLHFGIREHGMGMILNGIALEGLTRPYGGTFLVFSDYMRPAVRLAAIQQLPVTYVWTHDSIGLGEDGPTHQPIEHLAALRAIPGLDVVRPADANETAAAWRTILSHTDRPAGLALTRQTSRSSTARSSPRPRASPRAPTSSSRARDGDPRRHPRRHRLRGAARRRPRASSSRSRASRPASSRCPAASGSPAQTQSYRDKVLPPRACAPGSASRPASPMGWHDIVGDAGRVIGIEHFGASPTTRPSTGSSGSPPEAVVTARQRLHPGRRRELTDHDAPRTTTSRPSPTPASPSGSTTSPRRLITSGNLQELDRRPRPSSASRPTPRSSSGPVRGRRATTTRSRTWPRPARTSRRPSSP